MTEDTGLRFGQLVIDLGWMTDSDLEESLAIAKETDQPIGRVLAMRGHIAEKEVRSLVAAQSMLRDFHLTIAEARRALIVSSWSGMSFEDALLVCGANTDAPSHNRLGELLVDSGCIDAEVQEHALVGCQKLGMQLGRLLLRRNHISKSMLTAALEAQKLIRDGAISRDQAISGLTAIKFALTKIESDQFESAVLPLGRLCVSAGVLSDKQVNDALEVSRINGKPLGQVLVIFALMSESTLGTALELQELMRSNRIPSRNAVKALNLVYAQNISVQEALASVHDKPAASADVTVSGFLMRTGAFAESFTEIENIERAGSQTMQLRSLSRFVDEQKLRMAVRCTFLVRHSILSVEQALLAFHFSNLNEADLDEFLFKVGWVTEEALALISEQRANRHLCIVA
jgi:hypothetical protein